MNYFEKSAERFTKALEKGRIRLFEVTFEGLWYTEKGVDCHFIPRQAVSFSDEVLCRASKTTQIRDFFEQALKNSEYQPAVVVEQGFSKISGEKITRMTAPNCEAFFASKLLARYPKKASFNIAGRYKPAMVWIPPFSIVTYPVALVMPIRFAADNFTTTKPNIEYPAARKPILRAVSSYCTSL